MELNEKVAVASAPPPEQPPDAYVVHIRSTICHHCDAIHILSDIYEKRLVRARFGFGKVNHLTPLKEAPRFQVPVETHELETAKVPFCHECVKQISLEHLPRPKPCEDRVPLALQGSGPDLGGRAVQSKTPPSVDKHGRRTVRSLQDIATLL